MKLACAMVLALCTAPMAAAETITLVRKDGQQITGELLEFTADNVYRIRSGDTVWQVPESSVRTVLSTAEAARPDVGGAGTPAAPPAPPPPGEGPAGIRWDLDFQLYVQTEVLQARRAFEEGQLYEKKSDLTRARECYRRARTTDPWFLAARMAFAHTSIRLGDWPAAQAELETILTTDPANALAHDLNVLLFERKGDPEGAHDAYRRMVLARFPTAEAQYRLAHLYLRAGDTERARVYWSRYLEQDAARAGAFDEEAVFQHKAEAEAQAGNFDTARALLYEAMKRNPLLRQEVMAALAKLHETQANALAARGEFAGALDAYRRLAELDPAGAPARHDAVVRLYGEYLTRAALGGTKVALDEALARLEKESPTGDLPAILERSLDRLLAAATDDPGRSLLGPALAGVARLLLREPLPDGREAELRRKLAAAHANLADAAYRAKDYDLAAAEIRAAGKAFPAEAERCLPRLVEYSVARARARAAQRDYTGAMALLAEAGEVAPNSSAVRRGVDEVEFTMLKVGLEAEPDAKKREALLTTYLARPHPEEYRIYAQSALSDVAADLARDTLKAMRELRRYCPLALGNEHLYNQGTGQVRHRVTRRAATQGQEVFDVLQETTVAGVTDARTVQFVADPAGITRVDRDHRDLLFQFPVVVGRSWQWTEGNLVHHRTYRSTGETVVTKSGTYVNCLKIEFTTILANAASGAPAQATSFHYYAPNVGLVRVEVVGDTDRQLEMDLVSCKVEKE